MDTDRGATAPLDPLEIPGPGPSSPTPVPLRRRLSGRRIVRRSVFGLLASAFFLFVLECGARLYKAAYVDLHDLKVENRDRGWSRFTPELGWAIRPGYRGPEGGFVRSFDDHGYYTIDSRQAADPGARRVLFIGDSNTFGVGTPTEHTFAEVAERLTPGIAAINLGVPGYSSYQGRLVLERELRRLRPEAVVVSFNFNDKKAALPQIGPDGEDGMRRVWQSSHRGWLVVRQIIKYSALADLMRDGLARLRPPPVTLTRVDSMPTRVDPEHYRENLRAMAQSARQAGVPIVFVVLRDNPIFTHALTTGMTLLERRQYQNAIAHLRFAVYNDNAFSELGRMYLARAYRAIGYQTAADSVLVTDSPVITVFGGRPIHLDSQYNQIMRQVGAEFDAPVVDAGPVLHAHPNDFTDYCHFNAAAHERVGALVAAALREVVRRPAGGRVAGR